MYIYIKYVYIRILIYIYIYYLYKSGFMEDLFTLEDDNNALYYNRMYPNGMTIKQLEEFLVYTLSSCSKGYLKNMDFAILEKEIMKWEISNISGNNDENKEKEEIFLDFMQYFYSVFMAEMESEASKFTEFAAPAFLGIRYIYACVITFFYSFLIMPRPLLPHNATALLSKIHVYAYIHVSI
jgi:hypothetical protein